MHPRSQTLCYLLIWLQQSYCPQGY